MLRKPGGFPERFFAALRMTCLALLGLTVLLPRPTWGQHNHEATSNSEAPEVSDQVTSIPYFTLRDGLSSQLTLFNAAPSATPVTLTIYNSEGRSYSPPAIVLDAHTFKVVQLKDVVPDRDFDSGSIEVAFSGINMTAVTVQVSIYSLERRVLVESRHLHMFMSSNLNGIVWLPDAQADGFLAITNSGKSRRTIQWTVGAKKSEIVLFGHQSRLVKLNEETDRRASSPQLISLHHDGLPGDIIAGGFVLDLKKGYSATIPMVDPAVMRSSRLSGAHVRFGETNGREGFPSNTRFFAPLLLANTGDKPANVDVSVDYSVPGPKQEQSSKKPAPDAPDTVSTVSLKRVTIRPGDVERIELSRELVGLPSPTEIKETGIDIVYDTLPGTIIAQLTNVDESGDYSFEVPLKDPAAMDKMMEGGYPWTIEDGKDTTVYLKNTTDETALADAVIAFPDGAMYNLLQIELAPYQTLAIDLRKLKDSKEADWKGQEFAVTHGQFYWRQEIPYTIIGRAETLNLKDGIASSFTCDTGCCYFLEEDRYFDPTSYTGVVGTTISFQQFRLKISCDEIEYITPSSFGWDSQNTNVINEDALLVGAGSAGVVGQVHLKEYWEEDNVCYSETHHPFRYAQVTATAAISGPNTVWYFSGQNPSGYATSITLTSSGGSSTTWSVTAGSNKVSLSTASGSQTVVTSSGSTFSSSVGDISIVATAGGVDSQPFTLTSRRPASLHAGAVDTSCSSTWGYTTLVYYQAWDTLTDPLPVNVYVSENWTTGITADYFGTDWQRGNPGSDTTNASQGAAFADTIDGEDSSHTPLANCTGSDSPVQHWGQEWRLGSSTPGVGARVQTNTLQKNIKRAYHSSVSTGSGAW